MNLFPDPDEKKSIENAKNILKDYRKISRILGQPLTNYKSPMITDIPRSETYGNSIEDKIIDNLSAKDEYLAINDAMRTLSQECYQVLYYKYMSSEEHTNIWIAGAVFGTPNAYRTVQRTIDKGLLQFSYGYRGGKLLEFSKCP
ncbi:ArpU family phage packaging/lysis transcriptional regulator [Companilactobacillus sp. DQM5]|uniref:ArpU family phage packaging/lysis transcriptional regulator n=1 Tax=Companilactobacillus sp. DQM5 TaxID=3463359 RepID=UPI004057D48B